MLYMTITVTCDITLHFLPKSKIKKSKIKPKIKIKNNEMKPSSSFTILTLGFSRDKLCIMLVRIINLELFGDYKLCISHKLYPVILIL